MSGRNRPTGVVFAIDLIKWRSMHVEWTMIRADESRPELFPASVTRSIVSLRDSVPTLLVAMVALTSWVLPSSAEATEPDFGLEWGLSPGEVEQAVEGSVDGGGWRKFERRERRVEFNETAWRHFLVFYDDELIAQGYERDEAPSSPRVGTLSDIVSYDNDYWMAAWLQARHGEPAFRDVRTESDYSEELGDPARRAKRSVQWDLQGERMRWETDAGPIRYSVKFSLTGTRYHRAVKIDPGASRHYHFYQIARAFRRAGIEVVRRFEKKSKKMVVAMVTSSGETVKSEVDSESDELVAVEPEKSQRRIDECSIDEHDCTITVSMYGGRIYQVEVDLSARGRPGRSERGGFDKAGERVYRRYLTVNGRLEDRFGEPTSDTSVSKLEDDRTRRKVRRLTRGMEAFWTVWYRPDRDMLIRHVITGERSGAEWHVDHRVVFRLHSVTRAFADQQAFAEESRAIEQQADEEADPEEPTDDAESQSDANE